METPIVHPPKVLFPIAKQTAPPTKAAAQFRIGVVRVRVADERGLMSGKAVTVGRGELLVSRRAPRGKQELPLAKREK